MSLSMEASVASPSLKQPFLKGKLRVGSAKSESINYSFGAKVFHVVDVPREKLEAKRSVQQFKKADILGLEKKDWSPSTITDPKGQTKDLRRQLLDVRCGMRDEFVVKPSKEHSEEKISERYKYIVATTGRGPIGKLSGEWFNPVDERGLPAHSIEESWPDWNCSSSSHTRDDQKQRDACYQRTEQKRKVAREKAPKLNASAHLSPMQSVANLNHRIRERKVDFQEIKEQFKAELRLEYPDASEERMQAMAQRLLNEKLLADEKLTKFPVGSASFRPNLSLTTQDRRHRVYEHPGSWSWIAAEKQYGWSCCMNFSQDSRGCQSKIVNPDAWCTKGFERYQTG